MLSYKKFGAALGAIAFAFALTLTAADTVEAQQSSWVNLDGHAGIAIPMGDLADVVDPGPAAGLGFGYYISPRVSVRGDAGLDMLSGVDVGTESAADVRLWHLNGGFDFSLTEPAAGSFAAILNVGGGFTVMDSDRIFDGSSDLFIGTNELYPSVNGGLKLAFDLNEDIAFMVGGQAHLIFADEEDTGRIAGVVSDAEAFDTAVSIPVTAGLRVSLP